MAVTPLPPLRRYIIFEWPLRTGCSSSSQSGIIVTVPQSTSDHSVQQCWHQYNSVNQWFTNKKIKNSVNKCFNEWKFLAFVNWICTFVKPFTNRIMQLINSPQQIWPCYWLLLINRIFDSTIGYLNNSVNKYLINIQLIKQNAVYKFPSVPIIVRYPNIKCIRKKI